MKNMHSAFIKMLREPGVAKRLASTELLVNEVKIRIPKRTKRMEKFWEKLGGF